MTVSGKILMVEDNRLHRILLRRVLEHNGYEVVEAGDGTTGIRLAREARPDLVFMDLQLPVMDGYTAIRLLREAPETRDLKIIAVTAYAMKGDREKAIEAGADEYIPKPIDIKELPSLVGRLLGR